MWCNDARQAVACILLQNWGRTTSTSHPPPLWKFWLTVGVHSAGAQKRQALKLSSFLWMWSWNVMQWCSPSSRMHFVAELGAHHFHITPPPPHHPFFGTFSTLWCNNFRTTAPFFNLKAHLPNRFELLTPWAEQFPGSMLHGSNRPPMKKVVAFWAKLTHVRRRAMVAAWLKKGYALW